MINSSTYDADELTTNVDHLRAGTLIVLTVPLLRAVFHLRRIVGHQGQSLETTTSSDSTRGNEVVQRQRVEGTESATRTFNGLVDSFGRGIDTVGIVASCPHVLDVVPRLELLEALGMSIVDLLSVGDKLGRRGRSVGSRHFVWRMG